MGRAVGVLYAPRMTSRAWGVAGLLSGAIAGLILLAAVTLVPDPRLATPGPTAGPSPIAAASPASSASGPFGPSPARSDAPSASGTPSGSGAAHVAPGATGITLLHIGERAPVLAIQVAAGGFTDLAQLRGKAVWVVFMTTGCEVCAAQVPVLNGYLARYAANGLTILGVDVKEDAGTVTAFARRVGATFPFGLDLAGSAKREWAVLGVPTHFWIDGSGVIRDAAEGAIATEAMVHGLSQILPGVTVTP